jgi:hypothetical protein
MPMPEAAMDKHNHPVLGKDDVGATGEFAALQAESEAHPMQD